MAQVKNKEENKKETTKRTTKNNDVKENNTETKEKETTVKTRKPRTTTKKAEKVSKKSDNVVDNKGIEKETAKSLQKKEKTKATKTTKSSTTRKKEDTKRKTTNTKQSKEKSKKNTKGKVTKITASKKPEEYVETEDDIIITDANESKEVIKLEDEQKMQLMENEVEKDLKTKNKLPKEEERKLNTVVFQNLCVAIAFMIYLFFIILGFVNIKDTVYVVDLKVFSIILLGAAIALFEMAYKKDSGRLCAYGIETLFLSMTTMGLLYANIEIHNIFLPIAAIVSLLFAIYYVAKSIYLYCKMKKKYFVDNIKDIMQKEEKE